MIMHKTSFKFFRKLMKKSEVIDHEIMLKLTRKIDEDRAKKIEKRQEKLNKLREDLSASSS
ncbi:MAG: hypothetical protein HQK54_15715 [Oligoflexales bacterium]|nr:hypothetical protein [Oligoflexales bacterium]